MVDIRDGGTFALYVRDALGVATPTAAAIPPLTPAVARADLTVPPGFAADWDRWWVHSLGSGRTAGEAEHTPGRWPSGLPDRLRTAYADWQPVPGSPEARKARDGARTVFSQSLQELIADLKQELAREPVFTLELIFLPVEGQFWRRLDTHTVLVSVELLCSRNVIAPLESVIRDIEGPTPPPAVAPSPRS